MIMNKECINFRRSHSDSMTTFGVVTNGYFEKIFMVGFINCFLC